MDPKVLEIYMQLCKKEWESDSVEIRELHSKAYKLFKERYDIASREYKERSAFVKVLLEE